MLAIGNARIDCIIAPDLGGAILTLRLYGRDMLRAAPAEYADVLATACFPLVAFANRIAHGRMRIGAQTIVLPADPIAAPHAHHGHGWRRPWQVVASDEASASHAFRREAGDWPWRYRATQVRRLVDGLEIALALRNESATPMPAGLGLHPYFPRDGASWITTAAAAMLASGADGLPAATRPFAAGTISVAAIEDMDNLLLDLTACVVIDSGEGSVRIEAPGMIGFHLYVPPAAAFFYVEPVSHRPNSFGRAAAAEMLDGGTTMTRVIRFVAA